MFSSMTPNTEDDNLLYSVGEDEDNAMISDDFIEDNFDDMEDFEEDNPYEQEYGDLGDAWLEDNYQDNLQLKFRGGSDWG